ncbi:prepilin peptidase [bacterium]|nr:prepilin peptidase [bacterium]
MSEFSLYILEIQHNFELLPSEIVACVIALLAGMVGSFINMAVWRVPRRESIVFPRSHCPVCDHILGFSDLIPILSYLFLRGKCQYCKSPYGPRYMFIELLLVCIALTLYLSLGLSIYSFCLFVIVSIVIFLLGIKNSKRLDKKIIDMNENKKAFTFLEVMMTMVIVGVIIIPFGNLFISSYSRVIKNKLYLIAYNLAEEKIEELILVDFSKLKSDFEVYGKTPDRQDSIFVDEHSGKYQKMKEDEAFFERNFSDIYTEEVQLPTTIMKYFRRRYRRYYDRDYELYPDGYDDFKRTVKVTPVFIEQNKKFRKEYLQKLDKENVSLLKITVTVWIRARSLERKIVLSRYRKR